MLPANFSFSKSFGSLFIICKNLTCATQLHAQILINGLHQSVIFGTKLSHAYIELGSLKNAQKVFDQISEKNLRSWNTIISGYAKNGLFLDVLRLYKLMRRDSFIPDSFNLVFSIKACTGLCDIKEGKSIHAVAIGVGLETDSYIAPAIVKMYVECGCLDVARKVFDGMSDRNSVVWGVMINGYSKLSKEVEAFELVAQMRKVGCELDPFSVVGLVRACGNVFACREGKSIHGYCIKQLFLDSNVHLQTSIIDMYLKCGLLDCACKLFKEAPGRDVVLWSSMVARFAQNGRTQESLYFFQQMLKESMMPNMFTLASVLLAFSQLGALRQGKSVHGYVIRNGVELDPVAYTAFVDMYAKCGCIRFASKVFDQMPERNIFSWSAMIGGFGSHGLCSEALALYDRMRSENIIPNLITFVSLLSACSHSGRVEDGWHYFKSMTRDYGITPLQEHYACMVDLLGRAGQIEEAESFIEQMPVEPNASVWGALLGACGIHGRVDLAERVAEKLFVLEPDKSDAYVLLSNIYGEVGMWDKVKKTRARMKERGLHKTVGLSFDRSR